MNKIVKDIALSANNMKQETRLISSLGDNISISEVLKEMKSNNCFWLDTETTGLSSNDEVIELSICTHDKRVLFNSIIKSEVECSAQSKNTHGISTNEISNGMPIEIVKPVLFNLLEGKTVISFNADFDCKMLFQTFGLTIKKRFCVMKWSQSVLNYERWPRLEKVCERLCIKQPDAHRSLSDTITTIDVFNKLLDLTANHKSLLRDFALIDISSIEKLEIGESLFLSPNSDIFSFDHLIDRYGNIIIGIRSKALKRILKKEAARIFVTNGRKGKTLKIQYIENPDMLLPISIDELNNRLDALRIKKTQPNKYLSLKANISLADITKTKDEIIDGTFYIPSFSIDEKIYKSLENLPVFYNRNRKKVAFTIKMPKSTLKKVFALGLQGYSSILTVFESNNKIFITAQHLLDAQKITVLNDWTIDGEKAWSGDY